MRLPTSTYFLPSLPPYHDTTKLRDVVEKQAFRANILLAGPKGVGKTLMLQHIAASLKAPWVALDGGEDVRRSALAGMHTLRGQETLFVYGAVSTAFDIANEHGTCVLALEEVNALPPAVQKMLNPVCDFRRAWDVPEAQLSLRLREGAKLWVVGTLNYRGAGGIYDLNPDLTSRFRIYPIGYPDPDAEKALLKMATGCKDAKLLSGLVQLAKETRAQAMGYELSPRDLVGVVEDSAVLGLPAALLGLVGKYDPDHQDSFRARLKSVFKVSL